MLLICLSMRSVNICVHQASPCTKELNMNANSYDSKALGIRHFIAPYDMPSCFLL